MPRSTSGSMPVNDVVPIRRLDPDLPLPAYAHPGDAGADLVAAEDVELAPGGRAAGADRRRGGPAGRLRRAGAPAFRAGRPAGRHGAQRARYGRRRLPRRDPGEPGQSRPGRTRSRSPAATASPSLSCSGSSGPCSTWSTSCRHRARCRRARLDRRAPRAADRERNRGKVTSMFSRKRAARHVRTRRRPAVRRAGTEHDGRRGRARPSTARTTSGTRPPGWPRLDLGSLQIPAVEGVEVRVQANPEGGDRAGRAGRRRQRAAARRVRRAAYRGHLGRGPRRDVRRHGRRGHRRHEVDGAYGMELTARRSGPAGPLADVRYVGVDGPRWIVRAHLPGRGGGRPGRGAGARRVPRGARGGPRRRGPPGPRAAAACGCRRRWPSRQQARTGAEECVDDDRTPSAYRGLMSTDEQRSPV